MPGLRWATEQTNGPILELGAGFYSTPFLHRLSEAGRMVVSYEYDPEWFQQIWSRFEGPHHHVIHDFADVPPGSWSVVLVDCEGWSRHPFFNALRDHADIFVIHDTQDPWIPELDFESFEYRFDFGDNPRTTLLSMIWDVRQHGSQPPLP